MENQDNICYAVCMTCSFLFFLLLLVILVLLLMGMFHIHFVFQ